jgi:hypothetical protein
LALAEVGTAAGGEARVDAENDGALMRIRKARPPQVIRAIHAARKRRLERASAKRIELRIEKKKKLRAQGGAFSNESIQAANEVEGGRSSSVGEGGDRSKG